MNRSPAEYYIRYLLSEHDFVGMEADSAAVVRRGIVDELTRHDLGTWVTSVYLNDLIGRMGPRPANFDPEDRYHLPTRAWLRRNKIHQLYYPTEAVERSFDILNNSHVRRKVEGFILSTIEPDKWIHLLNEQMSLILTKEIVQAYEHYFFNKNLLSVRQWADYTEEAGLETFDKTTKAIALKISPDVAHLVMPFQAQMGDSVKGLTDGFIALRTRDIAFRKILEIERVAASIDHSRMLLSYSTVVEKMQNRLQQSEVALSDVLESFSKFRMKQDTEAIPSIEELSGGNYSNSGEGTDVDERIAQEGDYGE